MADNIALSTIGVRVGYALPANITKNASGVITAVESVWIKDIKSTPALDAEAEALDATTFAEEKFKKYIQGLKDLGGSLEFTANKTTQLDVDWTTFYNGTTGASTPAEGAIVIYHKDLTNMFVLPCQPQSMGLPELSVNSVFEQTVRVTPTGEPVQITKSAPVAPTTDTIGE